MNRLANIFQADVAHEGAGQQSGFTQDLKAVADAEDKAAVVGKFSHGLHHGRKFGDGAGAEIIAEGEAPGNDDGIAILQIGRVMPEESGLLAGDAFYGPKGVVVTVRTGKNDNAKFRKFEYRFEFVDPENL